MLRFNSHIFPAYMNRSKAKALLFCTLLKEVRFIHPSNSEIVSAAMLWYKLTFSIST